MSANTTDTELVELVEHDPRGFDYIEEANLEMLAQLPGWALCGTCGRAWNDKTPTAWTPAPGARCPFETDHADEPELREWSLNADAAELAALRRAESAPLEAAHITELQAARRAASRRYQTAKEIHGRQSPHTIAARAAHNAISAEIQRRGAIADTDELAGDTIAGSHAEEEAQRLELEEMQRAELAAELEQQDRENATTAARDTLTRERRRGIGSALLLPDLAPYELRLYLGDFPELAPAIAREAIRRLENDAG